MVKNVKNIVPWTYVIEDLKDKEVVGTFMKRNFKRLIKLSLGSKRYWGEKVIDCTSNDNLFNSQIDKKDIV